MNQIMNDLGLLVFRTSIGAFMLFGHGLGKFQKILSGEEIKFLNPFGLGSTASYYLATFAEFFASGLIILGLFSRLSSFSLIITMGVAAFIAHSGDPFVKQEKSLLFLVSFILLFLTGPGKFSLQTLIEKNIRKTSGITKFFFS